MALEKRELSDAEVKRLARLDKARKNKRGRQNPATVPARLTRTAAFAPTNRNLETDSNFRRRYVVPGSSVIDVSGRELGTQHRDAIYALFRLQRTRLKLRNPDVPENTTITGKATFIDCWEVNTTWRTLLGGLGVSHHVNNLMTLVRTFEDLKKVVITVFEGDPAKILPALEGKRSLSHLGAGHIDNILREISWDGLNLDSNLVVRFGTWVCSSIERSSLVSLNAEVQFRLRSGYAKSFWPYIDSMTRFNYVDEDMLGHLIGRDIKADDKNQRGQFRRDCKGAFDDMIAAGGIKAWRAADVGGGRIKKRRYYYTHALPRQAELGLPGEVHELQKVDQLSGPGEQADLFAVAS